MKNDEKCPIVNTYPAPLLIHPIHPPPVDSMLLGGNTLRDRGINERKWRWCVGFTPPPFVDSAGRKYPPHSGGVNEKEWGQHEAASVVYAVRCARNGVAGGYPAAPSSMLCKKNPPLPFGGGVIELERGSAWSLHRLIGLWNKKKGRRRHAQPPPSPDVSPCLFVPHSLASSHSPHSSSLPPIDFSTYIPRGGER